MIEVAFDFHRWWWLALLSLSSSTRCVSQFVGLSPFDGMILWMKYEPNKSLVPFFFVVEPLLYKSIQDASFLFLLFYIPKWGWSDHCINLQSQYIGTTMLVVGLMNAEYLYSTCMFENKLKFFIQHACLEDYLVTIERGWEYAITFCFFNLEGGKWDSFCCSV